MRFNKKSNVDASAKCGINVADGLVHVAVFEISIAERPDLDRIEGLGNGYEQESIHLEEFGECSTYIVDPAVIDETILPMDWYKEMVLLGCLSNRFPKEYIEYVERIGTINDPNTNRARTNWKIVEELRDDV